MNTKDSIRTFIAIELPEEIQNGLSALENRLKSSCSTPAKWIDPRNIHLTLKFLGQTPLESIPSIKSALDNISRITCPFQLSITEIGAFPNLQRVQVVWVGLSGDMKCLIELQKNVECAIAPLGYPTEKRPFIPHLSLARVRDTASWQYRQSLGTILAKTRLNASLNLTVSSLSLMQSQLTSSGSIYTNLHTARLIPSCA